MKMLLSTTMALGILLMFGANHPVEAKSHFSFYLGGPNYVAPPYYVAPQPYYYAEPHYYVAPQPYYYVEPQHCYRVYEYTPYGRVYHTECY